MTLAIDRILAAAARDSARAAMIFEGRVMTYGQLLALVSNAARLFHDRGIRPGDIVATAMGQSPLHLVASVALARLGAVALPQYSNLPALQRAQALERYGARFLVTDGTPPAAPTATVIAMRDLYARGDERDFGFASFVPAPDAPLRISLTSGTTGAQKAFLHTHGDFSLRIERRFGEEPTPPRVIPPMLHISSAIQLAFHALASGGVVVFPHPADARGYIAALHLYAVTHVKLPPADLAALLSLLPDDSPAFPSIRYLKVVGASPAPALLAAARRKFSPHVFASYSMAEIGMVASADADLLEKFPGTAGRVLAGARAEAVDEQGRTLPPGERGELRVSIEGMPPGYYGPDAALPGFRDGWFHAGDHGYVTRDGLIYVEGRSDNLLNIGGHKVAAEFVESILARYPGVGDVAVFGVDDAMAGTRVAAAIAAPATFDWWRLSAHAREALGHSAPARYYRIASLPRNEMGKIERKGLADWVAAHGEAVTAG